MLATTTRRNELDLTTPAGAPRYRRHRRLGGGTWWAGRPLLMSAPLGGSDQFNARRSQAAQRVLDIRCGSATRPSARPLVWRGWLRFSSDRIHKAVVEGLARGYYFASDEPDGPDGLRPTWVIRSTNGEDRLEGQLGFHCSLTGRERELLAEHRVQLIKLQFALWGRAFAETDADPNRPTVVTLSQLCEDLGYRRLQNGAHRPEHKRQVAEWLELLTSLQVEAEYRAPDGRISRLSGPLWRRFPDWEGERSIAFAPGPWYADAVWSRYNRRVGLIGAGFLSLRPDRDRWAISVGAFLASLARINGYRPLILRVSTVIERSGLKEAEQRNPSRMREMLERALEQLEASGLIAGWDWHPADPTEPDMDARLDLAMLSAGALHWTDRSITIHWPAPLAQRSAVLRPARENRNPARRTTRARSSVEP